MSGLTVSLIVFFAGLIVFHLLERVAPIYPAAVHGPLRRGYLADFTASVVNGPVLSSLTKLAAFYAVTLAPGAHGLLSSWPWILQFAVFLLVNDFARYWLHRWYHSSPLLWRIHRVHHAAVEMDALSTFRVHVLEAAIKYGVIVLPFRLAGIDEWVIVVYACADILKGFWHHANLRTYIGRLNYVFNSAEQHWWHHAIDFRDVNVNFGSILSIWDRLFGTFYWPCGRWPNAIGVQEMERFPETWLGQLASVRMDEDAARRAYSASAEPAAELPAPSHAPVATPPQVQASAAR